MNAVIAQASTAKAHQVHPQSFHPQVRAVLKRGADHLWPVKEIAQLLDLSERAVQLMLENGVLDSTSYPTRKNVCSRTRKVRSGSLLLYLVKNSTEMSEADLIASLGIILDQLPTSVLTQMVGYLQQKIARRASRPVLILTAEPAVKMIQDDLFSKSV